MTSIIDKVRKLLRLAESPNPNEAAALVRVNQALAKVEQRGTDVSAWMKKNLKLYSGSSSASRYEHSAREAGRKAGQSIRINRARGAIAS